jgi:hypothetical protein
MVFEFLLNKDVVQKVEGALKSIKDATKPE